MSPEFSRPVRIDTLDTAPRAMSIAADESERIALARRFGLVEIALLEADAAVSRNGEIVIAEGVLRAEVVQSCVATAKPVPARIEEPFRILFQPPPTAGPDEEIELGEGDMDVVFYEGAAIDFGEAVAETLSLGLDPYPRAPGADQALREAGVKDEAESGPFAALASLKDKLTKR